MKLFLLSSISKTKHADRLRLLLGKSKAERALFITAAAVPYGFNPRPEWLEESLGVVAQFTQEVDETSLEEGSFMPEDLSQYDFVFVSGGNSFYLAYRLAETGFGEKIKTFIKNGGVYVGSSAGAIVLMDGIEAFAPADDPKQAPGIVPGLGLLDFAIIPHADHEKYGPIMRDIVESYKNEGTKTITLNDDQALVVDGENEEVI